MDKTAALEYLQQGQMLLGKKQYEAAITYFEKAIKEDALNAEIYISTGIAYANLDKYDEAESNFKKALKINKDEGVVYFHLGNISFLKGDKSRGIENYNMAISKGYEEAQMYFSLGLMFEEEDNDNLAIRNYSKAIMKDPLRADIRIRKARLFINNKHFEEALQTLDEMIMACPDAFEGYHLKSMVLTGMDKLDEAQKVLDYAKKLYPSDPGFIIDQATLYASMEKYDEALKELAQAEEMDIGDGERHQIAMEKARVYALKTDMDSTIKCLEEAKQIAKIIDPQNLDTDATFFLMNCYLNIDKYENAISCAKELKECEQEGYFTLAAHYYEPICMQKLGKEEEAQEMFKNAVEYLRKFSLKSPGNVDSYAFRILCLRELKQYDKALELADYLIMVGNDTAETHTLRAAVLSDLGREDEAKAEKAKARSFGTILKDLAANKE
jgi:tetratricopeptide (TPR) repeat protein